ncbi:very short patch repair endonuclease [Rhizobium sp. KDH_Rht_773_N]
MADIVAPAVRSRMMAGIRSKNTKPEIVLRKGLHAAGFRFRLHDRKVPGTPDMVFPKWHAVIFVHGCFWHGHGCRLFKWPATREEFWREKIGRNITNDVRHQAMLAEAGWRVGIIWECATRSKAGQQQMVKTVADWLRSDQQRLELEAA